MHKLYTILFVFGFFTIANAQIIDFPDAKLKAKLLNANTTNNITVGGDGKSIKVDENNNGEIEVSEALTVYSLQLNSSNISDLIGISYFKNLKRLYISVNNIADLDLTELSSLNVLDCSGNQLTSLNFTGLTSLVTLECNNNQLTSLNLTGLTSLVTLRCNNNQLTSLNLTELTSLGELLCFNNQLTSLNLTGLTSLINLQCYYNPLTSLDLIGVGNLKTFIYGDSSSQLKDLDISSLVNLSTLGFYDIPLLSTINLSYFPKLSTLIVFNTLVETIDFTSTLDIKTLIICYSPFKMIDFSNLKKLEGINISGCPNLEFINLKNGIKKRLIDGVDLYTDANGVEFNFKFLSNCPKLQYICTDDFQLAEITQKIAPYNYTNCTVGSYCSFVPGGDVYTIKGVNRRDADNNGCDLQDRVVPDFKYTINNGSTTETSIADNTGNYYVNVNAGTYTITPELENPDYFTITPSSVTVTFPTQTSPAIQDFCITPKSPYVDLEITLLPIQVARPGFDVTYKIIYKNKGNTVQSGNINLQFNDAVLDLVQSEPAVTTQTINNLTWAFTNLAPFETREIKLTLNVNSPREIPAVNNGDILHYTATINSNSKDQTPNDNIFEYKDVVVGSYDPNDKTCLEGNIITPDLIGEYVHYLIRFENKGTYFAENVVITDIIDLTKFDISTLTTTSSSHDYVTKITKGNHVEFIFEKINLPFEDETNDGYIAFKIKTLPTLQVGDTFENEANIYFDYNLPILTNRASSTFAVLNTKDFTFTDQFALYPNPATDYINISNTNNTNLHNIEIYNQLGQLLIAVPQAQNSHKIDIARLPIGTYILKIKTDKGSSSQKFVKR